MDFLIDLLSGFLAVVQSLVNALAAGIEAAVALISGFVQVPTSLIGFFSVSQFSDTALTGFATVVLIGLGALVLRVIVNLF